MSAGEQAHHDLIDRLIARGALWSAPLIAAFRATPRQRFLDRVYHHRDGAWHVIDPAAPADEDLRLIYGDRAVTTRLSDTQPAVAISSSSQPSLMAQMLEDLRLTPGLRVLEIGAGTGYNAALLAHIVGPLVSIDIDREVLADARRHLDAFPDRPVTLRHADGRLGFAAAAPYDRILVTAAAEDVEPAWLDQLTPGGLVQMPLDLAPGLAWLAQGVAGAGVFDGNLMRPAYFMPLRDEGEAGRDRNEASAAVPGPERFPVVRPPYAGWGERRSADPVDFLPGVAFYGWLQGLAVGYATCPDGRPGHGVADAVRGQACWLGPHEWRVSGKGGHELAVRLWRSWLDLGGPRPGEWRLRCAADADRLRPTPGARAAYHQQGPRCARLWELIEPRSRPNLE